MVLVAHYLALVVGDHVDDELAIYDVNLPVAPYREYRLRPEQIPDGRDDRGPYVLSKDNRGRAKWDWYIMGGRWTGYLKLKHGAKGELGKPGQKEDVVLPYADLSADMALLGDVDWHGMRQALAETARIQWAQFRMAFLRGEEHAPFVHGIPQEYIEDEDGYIAVRSHPASFVVVTNTDWYERADIGWWGVQLDPQPVSLWNRRWDEIMSQFTPDTLVSTIDCHV